MIILLVKKSIVTYLFSHSHSDTISVIFSFFNSSFKFLTNISSTSLTSLITLFSISLRHFLISSSIFLISTFSFEFIFMLHNINSHSSIILSISLNIFLNSKTSLSLISLLHTFIIVVSKRGLSIFFFSEKKSATLILNLLIQPNSYCNNFNNKYVNKKIS